jgi:hypothetical protein
MLVGREQIGFPFFSFLGNSATGPAPPQTAGTDGTVPTQYPSDSIVLCNFEPWGSVVGAGAGSSVQGAGRMWMAEVRLQA